MARAGHVTPARPEPVVPDDAVDLVAEILATTDGDLARAIEILAVMVVRARAAVSVGYVRGRL